MTNNENDKFISDSINYCFCQSCNNIGADYYYDENVKDYVCRCFECFMNSDLDSYEKKEDEFDKTIFKEEFKCKTKKRQ